MYLCIVYSHVYLQCTCISRHVLLQRQIVPRPLPFGLPTQAPSLPSTQSPSPLPTQPPSLPSTTGLQQVHVQVYCNANCTCIHNMYTSGIIIYMYRVVVVSPSRHQLLTIPTFSGSSSLSCRLL